RARLRRSLRGRPAARADDARCERQRGTTRRMARPAARRQLLGDLVPAVRRRNAGVERDAARLRRPRTADSRDRRRFRREHQAIRREDADELPVARRRRGRYRADSPFRQPVGCPAVHGGRRSRRTYPAPHSRPLRQRRPAGGDQRDALSRAGAAPVPVIVALAFIAQPAYKGVQFPATARKTRLRDRLTRSSKLLWALHGPNLNLLGTREPEVYGSTRLDEIDAALAQLCSENGHRFESFQSNHEGALVDRVQQAREREVAFIVLNPAAFT